MNTRRVLRFSATVIASFTCAFQIESFMKTAPRAGFSEMASVSEALRLHHARELLGTAYAGSLPEQSAELGSVNDFVFKNVHDHLDRRWKPQSQALSKAILHESQKKGFDPLFVMAVIQTESHFDPTQVGSHGEIGLMQIRPNTAKWIAQKENLPWHGDATLRDPVANVKIGVAYMSFLRNRFAGYASRYVSAYNMGPTMVRRLEAQSVRPHEYSSRVMGNYNNLYAAWIKQDHRRPAGSMAQL